MSFLKHDYPNSPATIDLVFDKNNAAAMKAMLLTGAGVICRGGCYASSFQFFFLCLFVFSQMKTLVLDLGL